MLIAPSGRRRLNSIQTWLLRCTSPTLCRARGDLGLEPAVKVICRGLLLSGRPRIVAHAYLLNGRPQYVQALLKVFRYCYMLVIICRCERYAAYVDCKTSNLCVSGSPKLFSAAPMAGCASRIHTACLRPLYLLGASLSVSSRCHHTSEQILSSSQLLKNVAAAIAAQSRSRKV